MAVTDSGPLQGRRVAVTRPRQLAKPLCDRLRRAGAFPLAIPALIISPLANLCNAQIQADLNWCDWLLLPSPSAVAAWSDSLGKPPGGGIRFRVAVLGQASARYFRSQAGRGPDYVHEWTPGRNLAESLGLSPEERLLVLGSDRGSGPSVSELLRVHSNHRRRALYDVACSPSLLQDMNLLREGCDALVFTSPSAADCFLTVYCGAYPKGLGSASPGIACLGQASAAACRARGMEPDIVCRKPLEQELMTRLSVWFAGKLEAHSNEHV